MATSGSFNTNAVGSFYFTFSWYRTGYSSSANKHYLHWTVTAHNTAGSYRTVYVRHLWFGGLQIDSATGTKYYDGDIVGSGDITVDSYNDAGDGWIGATLEAGVGISSGTNISGEQSWDLDRIPRYTTVTNSQRGRTSSSISVNWSTTDPRYWTQYSLNDGAWTDAYDTVASDNKSGYYTISGLSANTTYKVRTRCCRTDSGLWSEASNIWITTYAKTTPTISLSSRTSSSITVTSSCNVTVSSTQYRIRLSSSSSWGSWQSSATFTGLSANTTYVVQVYKVASESGESGTAELSVTTYQRTIPTISLSSKTVNSITVSSSCNVTVSSTKYRIKTSSGSYGSYQTSATFSGLTPNTAYVVEVSKVGQASGETGTATLSVSTYAIATMSSYPNFNLGDSETITYSNPSGQTMNIGIYDTNGSVAYASYRTCTGSSYTFSFTDTELDALYRTYGSGSTITVRVYLRTTCNGSNYYDAKNITVTLTGNQKTGHVKINNAWKRGKMWVKINGTWKRAVAWTKINGTWKREI